jgi:hypothetical protein
MAAFSLCPHTVEREGRKKGGKGREREREREREPF